MLHVLFIKNILLTSKGRMLDLPKLKVLCRPEIDCDSERTDNVVRKGEMLMTSMPIFFVRIDDSHCDSNDSSLTAVYCFDNGYIGKQPMASKEYSGEFWLKEL